LIITLVEEERGADRDIFVASDETATGISHFGLFFAARRGGTSARDCHLGVYFRSLVRNPEPGTPRERHKDHEMGIMNRQATVEPEKERTAAVYSEDEKIRRHRFRLLLTSKNLRGNAIPASARAAVTSRGH
jgi:hypothetical protein